MPSKNVFCSVSDTDSRAIGSVTSITLMLACAVLTVGAGLAQPPLVNIPFAVAAFSTAQDIPPIHDASIGALAGEAKAEGGAAVYTIPITVPPGRMGLQPELSLNYSSRSGMGTAGLGWSLSGLSSLHRCPRTPEQDGETRAVQLNASDRLCLDGQRLLVVDGNLAPVAGQGDYGNILATYRTEVDSFVRVTQYGGSLAEAESCFKVEMKSGRIGYYGGLPTESGCSGDARVVPGGATAPLSWMLRQEVDPLGNTINYHYANSDANGAYGAGEMLLQSIDYSGNGDEPGDRSVTFVYTPSIGFDRTSSYAGGGLTEQTQLLTGIGTHDGTGPVRSYLLSQAASTYSHRSLLTAVYECASIPGSTEQSCHSSTTFGYRSGGEIPRLRSFHELELPGLPARGAQIPQTLAPPVKPAHSDELALNWLGQDALLAQGSRASQVEELGDFDGDGTRELRVRHFTATGVKHYLAAYSADRVPRGLIDTDAGLGLSDAGVSNAQPADINGDGRTELVGRRMSGGQRRIVVSLWNGDTSWLPANFTLHDLPIALPSPTDPLGCESVMFSDMNADGRADLLLGTPTSGSCGGTGPLTLRIYLGERGTDPLLPQFASAPAVTLPLGSIAATHGGTLNEGFNLMDFNGDGLFDLVVSRAADVSEQNRTLRLLFGRNVGGIYTLGGTGQEIATMDGLATDGLDDDETHKQAFTTWLDVNGDGLQDFISVKISTSDGLGYWSVRLNQGGTLGPRHVTTSRRGLERCVNNDSPAGVQNHCGVRWRPVYADLMQGDDVDSDGRADLLVPHAFAARVCVRQVARNPDGDVVRKYWCPEDPLTGKLQQLPPGPDYEPQDRLYGIHAPRDTDDPDLDPQTSPDESERFGGALDPNAYRMASLRFTGNADGGFDVTEETHIPIIHGQTQFDMYGDGLSDQVAYLGFAYEPIAPDEFPRYEGYALTGEGWGPDALPDGRPVADLQSQRFAYIDENIGEGLSGTCSPPPPGAGATAYTRSPHCLPVLPDLLDVATNGLGEMASWDYAPLGAGVSVGSLPFYGIPAQRYTDARHYYFASSMPVVISLSRSNGIGGATGARSQRFGYSEAIYNHQGRGFQGFRRISSAIDTGGMEAGRELRTTTTFHQKFPLTGLVESVEVAPNVAPFAPISRQVNEYRCTLGTAQRQVCPGEGVTPAVPQRDTVYFPYLDRQVATNYDLTAAEGGASAPVNDVETINASSAGASTSGWDRWGNLTQQLVLRRDLGNDRLVSEHRSATQRSYTSNTATWYLDRLSQETVTRSVTYDSSHTLPAVASVPTQTLVTDYVWNDDRTPASQTLQAGITHQEGRVAWCYRTPSADCPSVPSGSNYGLPSSQVVSAPDGGPPRRTNYVYSSNGIAAASDGFLLLQETNALGHTTTTERQPRDGQITRAISPMQTSVVTTYDAFGRPVRLEQRGRTGALIEPETHVALNGFVANGDGCLNGLGAIGGGGTDYAVYCSTTVKAGAPTQVTYHDMLGRPVKQAQRGFDGSFIVRKSEYDALGTLARQSMPRFASAADDLWQQLQYDRQGRINRQVDPAADLGVAIGDRLTRMTYSGNRTTTRVQDDTLSESGACAPNTACFETQSVASIAAGALQSIDANDQVTRHWGDVNGNGAAIANVAGVVTRATYDARGRRTQNVDPDQGSWSYQYNGLDELISQTDARGAVTATTLRDDLGRPRQVTRTPPSPAPAGMANEVLIDEWTYDPSNGAGQIDSVLRRRGPSAGSTVQVWKEKYNYEATTRRLSGIVSTVEGEAANWTSGVSYDEFGREDTRTYPSGLIVRSQYTDYGHLRELSNASTQASYWQATAADAWDKVTQETFGNGLSGAYQWAASTGQAKQLQWNNGPTTVEQLAYRYDSLGNLTRQTRGSISETYGYDALQRLTSTSLSSGGGVSIDYDAAGNLRKKSDFSSNSANAYSYGSNGCGPHAASSVQRPGGVVSYSCDANGNVISGSALTISFDVDNKPRSVNRSASGSIGVPGNDVIFRNGFQLGSAIDSAAHSAGSRQNAANDPEGGDGSMSYAYDSNGMRYAETVIGGATTRYGPRGYEKIIGSGTVHRHELGPVTVSRSGSTDTVSYLLRDRLGSTIAVTNTSGALSERRQFDAFGKARNADFSDRPNGQANLVATNHGFTGHTQADEVWLIHMNGRLYDQNLGRFLGVDPIIENPGSQALNPYSYLQNNPLSGTDPSGYAKASEECAGAGRAGCVGDQEVKATKAATMTGSHIAGVNTGASITLVNPTPGGMAELQVAAAGMSSGYVIQADAVEKSATSIAASRNSIDSKSPLPQDRPGASTPEGDSTIALMLTEEGSMPDPTPDNARGKRLRTFYKAMSLLEETGIKLGEGTDVVYRDEYLYIKNNERKFCSRNCDALIGQHGNVQAQFDRIDNRITVFRSAVEREMVGTSGIVNGVITYSARYSTRSGLETAIKVIGHEAAHSLGIDMRLPGGAPHPNADKAGNRALQRFRQRNTP